MKRRSKGNPPGEGLPGSGNSICEGFKARGVGSGLLWVESAVWRGKGQRPEGQSTTVRPCSASVQWRDDGDRARQRGQAERTVAETRPSADAVSLLCPLLPPANQAPILSGGGGPGLKVTDHDWSEPHLITSFLFSQPPLQLRPATGPFLANET